MIMIHEMCILRLFCWRSTPDNGLWIIKGGSLSAIHQLQWDRGFMCYMLWQMSTEVSQHCLYIYTDNDDELHDEPRITEIIVSTSPCRCADSIVGE